MCTGFVNRADIDQALKGRNLILICEEAIRFRALLSKLYIIIFYRLNIFAR